MIAADFVLFRKQDRKRTGIWFAGAAIVLLAYAALRVQALGGFLRTTPADFLALSIAHSSIAFAGLYLSKMLFPCPLNAFYHFATPLSFKVSGPGFVLAVSAAILIFSFRKNKTFVLGGIWFALFLLPALVLRDVSPVLFAERYLFLPSAGFVLAVVSLPMRRPVLILLIVVCVLFAGISHVRSKVWHDDRTLWTDTLKQSPDSHTVNYNLATAHFKNKDYSQAIAYYRRAISIDPLKPDSYYNRALCEYNLGRKDLAADSLRKFLEYAPANHPFRNDAEQKLALLD
jgi:tetratricopeptide (TPR) repeat protein